MALLFAQSHARPTESAMCLTVCYAEALKCAGGRDARNTGSEEEPCWTCCPGPASE
ncbi:hypothetical protein AJ80_02847 [Polytolypa hystricis UAMH7299]|uniref:Uncharacterized protein n=1 Tax=Polytolypa hystricis (strain UAMH7299) TaxID=1447883 RepID=A0A2B7YQ07_POLH7|nr:hypothetical protein AJ80_02847 [Polytolypa hystricis UAMH7299]